MRRVLSREAGGSEEAGDMTMGAEGLGTLPWKQAGQNNVIVGRGHTKEYVPPPGARKGKGCSS